MCCFSTTKYKSQDVFNTTRAYEIQDFTCFGWVVNTIPKRMAKIE